MNPFDFINAITFDKTDLFTDPQAEKDYVPFIVNRGLSYFPDTVMFANEANLYPLVPKHSQFDYLRHSVAKRRRFSKWAKKDVVSQDVTAVAQYYKYSLRRATEVLPLLNEQQLTAIRAAVFTGGKQ